MRYLPLMATVLLCACTEAGTVTPGIHAEIRAIASPAAAEHGRTFYTAEDKRIDLLNGLLVLSPVAVTPCDTLSATLWDLLMPAAYAHGGHVEAPRGVIDVSAAGELSWDLGAIPLSAGKYCFLDVEVWPLPSDIGPDLSGASLYLAPCWYPDSGTVADVPDADPQPDEVAHTCYQLPVRSQARKVSLDLPSPVELDSGSRTLHLTVAVQYERWFDGVNVPDLASDNAVLRAAAEAKLLDNVAASLAVLDDSP